METWMLQAFIVGLVGVIGYFLRQKDTEQGQKIDKLFALHDKDADRLVTLELKIAQEHYVKPELDARFTELKFAIKESMDVLGNKFDKLSDILITHIAKEGAKDDNRQK